MQYQVQMCIRDRSHTVQLDSVETGFFRPNSRLGIFIFYLMNLFNRQRPGFFIAQSHHKGIWHGNRAGGYRLMTGDRPSGAPPRVDVYKRQRRGWMMPFPISIPAWWNGRGESCIIRIMGRSGAI